MVGIAGTVLLVGDDEDLAAALVAGLRDRGFRVIAVRDGVKALSSLASVPVDVIVLELGMPVMSGWEFLETRSGDRVLASIPVIAISGAATGDGPWSAFVEKPCSVDRIVAAIERCRRSRAEPTPQTK